MPGVGPCQFMAARHGTISQTLRAGVPLWGGLEGGGGLAVVVCTLPRSGGIAGGSLDRFGCKNPAASPGLAGPFEEEARIRRGGFPLYRMVWYGMIWYGMVWYGMVCCCCCCCEGTQRLPAGEIARHALPGQGAREESAGVTLAGRVPTTTEGGGGAPWCGGGGVRAHGGGRSHLCVLPWSPPPLRGGG